MLKAGPGRCQHPGSGRRGEREGQGEAVTWECLPPGPWIVYGDWAWGAGVGGAGGC